MLVNGLLSNFDFCYRNPRHRVIPFPSLPGSINAAFVDVNDQDPDFGSIQGKDLIWN